MEGDVRYREVEIRCSCGNEMAIQVREDRGYDVVCEECGKEYRDGAVRYRGILDKSTMLDMI